VRRRKKEDVIIYVERTRKEIKIKTKYDFNIKNGVCMYVSIKSINQSLVIIIYIMNMMMVWYGMVWYMA